jgi:WD40 repeat protein
MKIDVVERFSVASFLDDGINGTSVSKNRISIWLLVDMNLRGIAGLAIDENSMTTLNSVPNMLIVGTESGRLLHFSLPTANHSSSVVSDDENLQTNAGLTADSAVGAVPNFRSIRPVEISIPLIACHTAQISALMVLWQTNPPPAATTNFGARYPQDTMLIFSGSLDRTIKIWNFSDLSNSTSGGSTVGSGGSSTGQTNVLAQTLCGHTGAITQIVDGSRDGQGSILSSSMDGSIRVWVAQK